MPDQLSIDFERAEKEAAWTRAETGMTRAASRAERVAPGWHEDALAAIRSFAQTHDHFLSEHVRKVFPTPDGADGRCWGALMREAARRGWIERDGHERAVSSNLTLKVNWRSLICAKESA